MSSPEIEYTMMTVEGFMERPSLELIAQKLGISTDDLDPGFGVNLIDPAGGVYCVQVRLGSEMRSLRKFDSSEGPWSSPRIDTFN
jgi:hypothetical protein